MTKPEDDFLQSITGNDNSHDLLKDLSEVGIDALLTTDGVLKDIPILGTAFSILKLGNDVSAHFFAKRILSFLKEVDGVARESREKFFEKKDNSKIAETLLMILDKQDDYRLSELLGKAFKLYVLEVISKKNFEYYVHIIRNLNLFLLEIFCDLYSEKLEHDIFYKKLRELDYSIASTLAQLGLLQQNTGVEIKPSYVNRGSTRERSQTDLIKDVMSQSTINYTVNFIRSDWGWSFYDYLILGKINTKEKKVESLF
jgi:hypothetical protein